VIGTSLKLPIHYYLTSLIGFLLITLTDNSQTVKVLGPSFPIAWIGNISIAQISYLPTNYPSSSPIA
jgi:hypothetical protein